MYHKLGMKSFIRSNIKNFAQIYFDFFKIFYDADYFDRVSECYCCITFLVIHALLYLYLIVGKRIVRPEFVFPHYTRDANTNNLRNEGLNKESLQMEKFSAHPNFENPKIFRRPLRVTWFETCIKPYCLRPSLREDSTMAYET